MRRLIALGSFALLAGCSAGSISDVDPFIGLYSLVSVDGAPLPVAGSRPGADPRVEIARVDVTLKADHSAGRVELVRVTPAGGSSVFTRDERSGTVSMSGDTITIDFPGSNSYIGTIGGEVLVLVRGDDSGRSVHLFRRDRTFE
jgi:hypothetical protein